MDTFCYTILLTLSPMMPIGLAVLIVSAVDRFDLAVHINNTFRRYVFRLLHRYVFRFFAELTTSSKRFPVPSRFIGNHRKNHKRIPTRTRLYFQRKRTPTYNKRHPPHPTTMVWKHTLLLATFTLLNPIVGNQHLKRAVPMVSNLFGWLLPCISPMIIGHLPGFTLKTIVEVLRGTLVHSTPGYVRNFKLLFVFACACPLSTYIECAVYIYTTLISAAPTASWILSLFPRLCASATMRIISDYQLHLILFQVVACRVPLLSCRFCCILGSLYHQVIWPILQWNWTTPPDIWPVCEDPFEQVIWPVLAWVTPTAIRCMVRTLQTLHDALSLCLGTGYLRALTWMASKFPQVNAEEYGIHIMTVSFCRKDQCPSEDSFRYGDNSLVADLHNFIREHMGNVAWHTRDPELDKDTHLHHPLFCYDVDYVDVFQGRRKTKATRAARYVYLCPENV